MTESVLVGPTKSKLSRIGAGINWEKGILLCRWANIVSLGRRSGRCEAQSCSPVVTNWHHGSGINSFARERKGLSGQRNTKIWHYERVIWTLVAACGVSSRRIGVKGEESSAEMLIVKLCLR